MQPIVSIRKPCSEDWTKMTPQEQGRHCDKCCKVVVDFSGSSDQQIIDYLEHHSGSRVCGRFRKEQVSVPAVSATIRKSRVKVFLAALVFVFGAFLFTSCNNNGEVVGKFSSAPDSAMRANEQAMQHTLGDTILPREKADSPVKKIPGKCIQDPGYKVMGDVAILPVDTSAVKPGGGTVPQDNHPKGEVMLRDTTSPADNGVQGQIMLNPR
ncbi:MAG TPA: hypothetical protein VFU15_04600 [Bacteroidia bacterium]|nr:hypothetical protein [Bacteroidia bacterium]